MSLRLTTMDENARSALDCGREAAALGFSRCRRFASFPFRRKGQGGSCCYRSKSGSFAAAVQSAFRTVIFRAEALGRREKYSHLRASAVRRTPRVFSQFQPEQTRNITESLPAGAWPVPQ